MCLKRVKRFVTVGGLVLTGGSLGAYAVHTGWSPSCQEDDTWPSTSRLQLWTNFFVCQRCSENLKKLARATHSSNHGVRQAAARKLSRFRNLSDWEVCQVAQACSTAGLASLARTENPRIAVSAKPLPKDNTPTVSLEYRVRALLFELLENADDVCVQFTTSLMLQQLHIPWTEEQEVLWNGDDDSLDPNQFKSSPNSRQLISYLEALGANSAIASQRVHFHSLKVLMLLRDIWDHYVPDQYYTNTIRVLILKVMGNLSVCAEARDAIVRTGWLHKFVDCLVSTRLELRLHATKALANMDGDSGQSTFDDGIYVVNHPTCDNEDTDADIVFVHGLKGGVFKTWRQRDVKPRTTGDILRDRREIHQGHTMCWPQDWLAKDFPKARIILVDYSSFLSKWGTKCPDLPNRHNLMARSRDLELKLLQANVGLKPIVWVTHSMGGLIVKQLLSRCAQLRQSALIPGPADRLLDQSKAVVFYATPHYGTPVANHYSATSYRYFVQPSIEVDELQVSSFLRDLHDRFKLLATENKVDCLSFTETMPTRTRVGVTVNRIVPEESADPGIGDLYRLNSSHFNICKPPSREASSYTILLQFLEKTLKDDEFMNNNCDFMKLKDLYK